MSFIAVVGSAHMDILSTIVGDVDTVDKIGRLSIHFGGTAYNIAINLAGLGESVRFISGMKKSPFSNLILDNLKEHKVDAWVIQRENLPLGGFSAHLWNGELVSAVSSMPVEMVHFENTFIEDALRGAEAVILECNLSPIQLQQFAAAASKLGIPVFVAAVSEEKSLRLRMIRAPLEFVFMNRREAEYLVGNAMDPWHGFGEVKQAARAPVVVTLAENGALVTDSNGTTHVPAALVSRGDDGNFLGAGDLMLSLAIHHYLGDCQRDMRESLTKSMNRFPELAFRENCNLEDTGLIEQRMEDVDRQAKYDGMTSLYNRRTGEMLLASEISRCSRNHQGFSVMIFDIDHFKSVNDTWGHDVGDDVIKGVSKCLRESIRPHDIAARWGGEEFVCILPGTDMDGAFRIAERLRERVMNTIQDPRVITISIGLAEWSSGRDAKSVVESADKALYFSKKNGRNKTTKYSTELA